jgi:hypothetical protein
VAAAPRDARRVLDGFRFGNFFEIKACYRGKSSRCCDMATKKPAKKTAKKPASKGKK